MDETILIVEDDRDARMEIDSVLVQSGYYVAGVASDDAAAIALGNVVRPNVVVIDVHQGADRARLDLAAELKATFAAPVIVVADTSDHARGVEVSALHPAAVIVKPIRAPDVLVAIRRAIGVAAQAS
ncbi:MAG TPA: response regulator [Alphaproteobacteria bacterium]